MSLVYLNTPHSLIFIRGRRKKKSEALFSDELGFWRILTNVVSKNLT